MSLKGAVGNNLRQSKRQFRQLMSLLYMCMATQPQHLNTDVMWGQTWDLKVSISNRKLD